MDNFEAWQLAAPAGRHPTVPMGVGTLMKPLPSSNVRRFPNEVRMQVEDLSLRPWQNSTMLLTDPFFTSINQLS